MSEGMDRILDWENLETLAKTTSSAEKGLQAGRCTTCANSTLFRRKGQMSVIVRCSLMEEEVPSDIDECSGYSDPKAMSLYEMRQIAFIVDVRKGVDDKSYI